MDNFDSVVSMLEYIMETERRRHITGGVLLSVSLLFAGLAITVITSKNKEDEKDV